MEVAPPQSWSSKLSEKVGTAHWVADKYVGFLARPRVWLLGKQEATLRNICGGEADCWACRLAKGIRVLVQLKVWSM